VEFNAWFSVLESLNPAVKSEPLITLSSVFGLRDAR
jgi:hypothetical protein